MFGAIEGPIHQMMLKFPNEFKFVRHESTRALRPSKAQKKKDEQ